MLTAVVPDKLLVSVLVFLFAFGVCSASGLLKRGVEISIQTAHKHLKQEKGIEILEHLKKTATAIKNECGSELYFGVRIKVLSVAHFACIRVFLKVEIQIFT